MTRHHTTTTDDDACTRGDGVPGVGRWDLPRLRTGVIPALALLALLMPATVRAQEAPGTFTTLTVTDTGSHAFHVGCPVGSTACIGGMVAGPIDVQTIVTAGKITIATGVPAVTTNALYNNAGGLWFNGAALATGASVSGTTGAIPKFTSASALGNSIITEAAGVINVAGAFSVNGVGIINATGKIPAISSVYFTSLSGANLTGIPTSAVSTGNYVATVTGGTGISVASGTGNASAPAVSLANTAVTPATLGSATAIPTFTVDQQGRLTSAINVTPQLTLTATYFSSLSGVNLTGVALLAAANAFSATNTFGGGWTQFTAATGSPASGAGFELRGGATPSLTAFDRTGGAYLPGGFDGLSHTFNVSGVGKLIVTATAVAVGGTNVTDAFAAPTITSGAGTTGTIAGKAFAFKVTVGGTGISDTVIVNLNTTYANPPVCFASVPSGPPNGPFLISTGSAAVNIVSPAGVVFTTGQVISVLCRGY